MGIHNEGREGSIRLNGVTETSSIGKICDKERVFRYSVMERVRYLIHIRAC